MSTDRREYLGDGVYAWFDGYQIWLVTSNGYSDTNSIALEPSVFDALLRYREALVARIKSQRPTEMFGVEAVDALRHRALNDVAAERSRQVVVEGWTAEHDDRHRDGSLADAAAAYIMADGPDAPLMLDFWPWAAEWWKPRDRRRNLVRAAALILAEVERLDRLPPPPTSEAKP